MWWIVLIVVVLLVLYFISVYNNLVNPYLGENKTLFRFTHKVSMFLLLVP